MRLMLPAIVALCLAAFGCAQARRMEVTLSGPDAVEGFIPVTGGRVWYRMAGPHKIGTPLIVVHGGPGANHDYLEPLEALAVSRPVIFYDQLGCGNSDAPDDMSLYTLGRSVEELGQVRRALGLRELFILGQSYGSMVAVEYAAGAGGAGVAGLILSGPFLNARRFASDQRDYLSLLPPEVRATIEQKEAAGDYAGAAYQEAAMVYYKKHMCRLDPWPENLVRSIDRLNMRIYEHMWGPSEFTVTGTLKNADSTGKLAQLAMPVLYTCGRFDESAPATCASYQSKTKHGELIVFEDASHMHHLERQADYLEAVGEFLARERRKQRPQIQGMQ